MSENSNKAMATLQSSENTIRRSEAVHILRKAANTMSSGKITQRR